jgi:hypothetical protein
MPLMGGDAIFTVTGSKKESGTLSLVLRDKKQNKPAFLTAAHVIGSARQVFATVNGDERQIGTKFMNLSDSPPFLDAAIVRAADGDDLFEPMAVRRTGGEAHAVTAFARNRVLKNKTVVVVGAFAGVIPAKIVDNAASLQIETASDPIVVNDVIVLRPKSPLDSGDSGAPVVLEHSLVGIYCGRAVVDAKQVYYALPIDKLLSWIKTW